jgi:protein gp37
MAEKSLIEFCDHTFNGWIGCTKKSLGCLNCYAERDWANRWNRVKWGPAGERLRTSPENWKKPIRWNKDYWAECIKCHQRGSLKDVSWHLDSGCDGTLEWTNQRVFAHSLSDVFEGRPELEPMRIDLFRMIFDTPHLNWLLLTKYPENIIPFMDSACWPETGCPMFSDRDPLPPNVWMGVTAENQKMADERIPILLKIPARIRFVACGPLLGPINLELIPDCLYDAGMPFAYQRLSDEPDHPRGIHWIIAEGESGPGARQTHPDWVRSLSCQADDAGIPFLFKQWGEWLPDDQLDRLNRRDPMTEKGMTWKRVGRKESGRLLDGREWMEFPE